MLQTDIITPESYQPIQIVYDNTSRVFRAPIFTTYEQLAEITPKEKEVFRSITELEEGVLGTDRNSEDFYLRHYEFLEECDSELESMLPDVRDRLAANLAGYFADESRDVSELETLFRSRLDGVTDISASDPLIERNQGEFRTLTRRIHINGLVFLGLKVDEVDKEYISDVLVAHEAMHSVVSSAITRDAMRRNKHFEPTFDIISRNGITTVHTKSDKTAITVADQIHSQHSWLTEAGIEDVRQRVMKTDETGYVVALSLLRTIYDLHPDLQQVMESVIFFGASPAKVVGLLEDCFGPLFVEDIEELLVEAEIKGTDIAEVSASALEMFLAYVAEDKKIIAGEIFKKHYLPLLDKPGANFAKKYKSVESE